MECVNVSFASLLRLVPMKYMLVVPCYKEQASILFNMNFFVGR